MFILDATTKSLKANLTAAATTTNPDFATAWADSNGTTFTGGSTDGAFNGTTDVTLAAAPSSGNQRYIKFARIHNRDSAAVTVNIKYDNNGTQRIVQRVTLGSGETWTPDASYDVFGNYKQNATAGTTLSISGYSGSVIYQVGTSMTISGIGFLGLMTVRFIFGGTIADVSVNPVNSTTINVNVPSTIYNLAANTQGTLNLIDAAGRQSNSLSLSVFSLPTGGTITINGSYRIHSITSSTTFTTGSYVPTLGYEYLIVAGGGAGGGSLGGGGGAGGYLTGNIVLTGSTAFPITIGAGGTASSGTGGDGSNSVGLGLASTGGGGGSGGATTDSGRNGGSGGGGSRYNGNSQANNPAGTGVAGPPRQGYNGGTGCHSGGATDTAEHGGGGGGAGQAGQNGSAVGTPGAYGGAGLQNNIDFNNYYYAGGGGGCAHTVGTAGAGGIGGGGGGGGTSVAGGTGGGTARNAGGNGTNGGNSLGPGGAGGANTGGGGGGGGWNSSIGGNGASGIVIIRYIVL